LLLVSEGKSDNSTENTHITVNYALAIIQYTPVRRESGKEIKAGD